MFQKKERSQHRYSFFNQKTNKTFVLLGWTRLAEMYISAHSLMERCEHKQTITIKSCQLDKILLHSPFSTNNIWWQ